MKIISTGELAQRVAADFGAPEEQTHEVLSRAVALMAKELRCGNSIDLDRFLTLRLEAGERKPVPSKAGPTLDLPAGRTVDLRLNEDLRREIEGADRFQILLVVERKNFFTGIMAARLASERSEVIVLEGTQAVYEWVKNKQPDLVVLDAGLENGHEISRLIKTKKRTSLAGVIEVLPEGTDLDNGDFTGLMVPPDERLVEPFELSNLVKTVESELSRCTEERNYFEHVVQVKLHTEEELIESANELVGEMLAESGLEEEAVAATAVAFREAIDNAARHGNKNDPERVVTVQYLVDREKVTLTISDEGEGFDTEVYLSRGVSGNPVEAARERNRAGGAGGLGIMLMLKCVDKLEYKYTGNTVSLTKRIRGT